MGTIVESYKGTMAEESYKGTIVGCYKGTRIEVLHTA